MKFVRGSRKCSRSRGTKLAAMFMVLMLLAITGCSERGANSGIRSQASETIELKLAHFWPATHPVELELVQPWAKEIERATQGRVKVTSYSGETLLKANDVYDGVVKGIADIGISCFSYTRGRFPVCEVFELPGITYNSSKAASKVAWEGIKEINPKEVQDTKLLMVLTTGPGDLYTKFPVRTLADLKGLEVRATGMSAKTLTSLGATPVGMPQSEAYEALSKGMVKGNLGPDEVLKGWRQAEVTQYITKTPFLYNTLFFVTMNKDKWNSLDPVDQKAIEKVNNEFFEKVAMGLWDKQNEAALEWSVNEKKMELITLTPAETQKWIDKVSPVQREFVDNLNQQGLNGQQILNRVKALAEKYDQEFK